MIIYVYAIYAYMLRNQTKGPHLVYIQNMYLSHVSHNVSKTTARHSTSHLAQAHTHTPPIHPNSQHTIGCDL